MNCVNIVHCLSRRVVWALTSVLPGWFGRGIILFLLVLFGVRPLPAQMIDLNNNGMSDIWEWLYGSYGMNPAADPDQDGSSNLQEAHGGHQSV